MSSTMVMEKSAQTQNAKKLTTKKKKEAHKKRVLMRRVWFLGHSAVVVLSGLSALAHIVFLDGTLVGQIVYRLAFAAAAFTYGFSLRQKLYGEGKNRQRPPSFFMVLHFATAQYFLLSLLWLVSRQHLLKLTPYVVYSLLQAAEFAATYVIKDEDQKARVHALVNDHAYQLEVLVAYSNVLLCLRLLLDVLLIRTASGLSFMAMLFTFRFSMQNRATKDGLKKVESLADKLLTHEKVPAKVQDVWKKIKWSIDTRDTYALSPAEKREQDARRKQLLEKEAAELAQAEKLLDEGKLPDGPVAGLKADNASQASTKKPTQTNGSVPQDINKDGQSTPNIPAIQVNGQPQQ
ncbi:hypothetical protein TRVA0_001S09560 [Trichomonascus vanleenenianus]|uniref:uncharacterized protein n=1 Tax=Trichomonascus vanleenenianus TaxID=2268995 RepID=UPI003ECA3C3C